MGKAEVWLENDRIRREGTRNLVEAALASKSVETVLFESYGMVYPDSGDAWIDADSTPAQPTLTLTSTIDGEAAVASFAEAGHRGISLRMGMIYGPESPAAWEQLRYLQMGIAAFPGSSNAYLPQVWVQDAARAIVVALTEPIPSGIYDIVDDDPLTRGELIATIAQAAGKKHYLTLPNSIMKMMTGIKYEDASRGLRTSNRRFKEVSNWRPTVPDARTGWKRMMEEQKVAATA